MPKARIRVAHATYIARATHVVRAALGWVILLVTASARASGPECIVAPSSISQIRPASEARCFATTFFSPSLQRKIEINLLLPRTYGEKAIPYAIFLHGRGGDRKQIVDLGAIQQLEALEASGGEPFVIVAPSGGDHYWVNAAISKERWGDMVAKDLVAWIEETLVVKSGARALFGISMGAAGALQLGLNHPSIFPIVMSDSPIFRREQDIWTPDSMREEPHEDYDSFGQGEAYRARSPRALCQSALKMSGGQCLPFRSFRLDIGERDALLDRYPDTRAFILELMTRYPRFHIAIERCQGADSAPNDPERDGHTYVYWRCQMPTYLRWLSEQLSRDAASASD